MSRRTLPLTLLSLSLAVAAGLATAQSTPPMTPDIPAKYDAPDAANDFIKRVVEIPMRDGVTLHTVIVIPKGAKHAPILLTRTPYNADGRAARADAHTMRDLLPQGDEVFVDAGYIRVFQDVRGKYG
ncbi:CocE/NonD family hydrolase, partial [Luteibacter yeojuensis]